MYARNLLFFLLLCLSTNLFAQDELAYSYITDKRYRVVHELDGEVFVPAGYQEALADPDPVSAGEILVKFFKNKVVINGLESITDDFFIVNRYPDRKVGFVYELMDSRNKTAKLKVVMDEQNYVMLLYFNSKKWGEHTFYLAEKTANDVAEDKKYYTSNGQYFVRSFSNLLDKKIVPYQVVKDHTASVNKELIEKDAKIFFEFKEKEVKTKWGNYTLKNAKTAEFKLKDDSTVKSRIAIDLKGKLKQMYIYLNYKKEIAFIEVGKQRFYLMP